MTGIQTHEPRIDLSSLIGTWRLDPSKTTVVDAAFIDTAKDKRDNHLRGKDFFEVERDPTFTYAVTSAALGAGGSISILGTFTAHGQTHPLPTRGSVTSQDGATLAVTVEADVDRSGWGMGWTKMGARVDNHITVVAVFTRP